MKIDELARVLLEVKCNLNPQNYYAHELIARHIANYLKKEDASFSKVRFLGLALFGEAE